MIDRDELSTTPSEPRFSGGSGSSTPNDRNKLSVPVKLQLNSKHLWRRQNWLIIGLFWLIALVLGYTGFAHQAVAAGQLRSPLDLVYLTLQLISLESGLVEPPVSWQLQLSRFLLPLLAAWTAAQALVTVFRNRWQQFLVRTVWRDHVVICGLSRKGWLLARGFSEQGTRVAIIETDEDNDLIGACRERGIPVFLGDAAAVDLLQSAAVLRAQHVIAVTDDDGVNAEIAVRAQELLDPTLGQTRSYPLTCTVHIVDPQLCDLARAREMSLGQDEPVRLELFNVFDRGARLLWNQFGSTHSPVSSGSGNTGKEVGNPVHILVIGLGRLGESLVVHAAREWYMQQHDTLSDLTSRIRITVIDQEADWKCRSLKLRYNRLEVACDLNPMALDVRWPAFLEGSFLASGKDYPAPSVVFVCFDDDLLSLRTGLDVHHRLRQTQASQIPVVVRMTEAGGLAKLLGPGADDQGTFTGLQAFGLIDSTCSPEVVLGGTHMLLALNLHENYVRRLKDMGETAATNPALVPWDQLPDALRQSNLAAADAIGCHLRLIGYELVPLTDWDAAFFRFSQSEAERLAELEHERFVAERLKSGWQYAEGLKDLQEKTSPTLVPWSQLSDEERSKDLAIAEKLPFTLAKAGFQVVHRSDSGANVASIDQ